MTAPIRDMAVLPADAPVAVVRQHHEVLEVFRMMKDKLGLTNEFIDDVGGLTKGNADKILGPTEAKGWGPITFDLFCELFAIEFRVYVDLSAVARMEGKWEKRLRPVESSHTKRVSKRLLTKAKPIIVRHFGQIGGMVRAHMLSPKQRTEIASKAAKSRWKKARAIARQARAAKSSQAAPSGPGRR